MIDSFNYDTFVVDAVNSVKHQSVSFDEIIVVDDCSPDNSIQVLILQ
jgi:glycosyltransferase involved in cell wall biosynthesis